MSTSPRRLGKYELQQRLGYGGMAEVWKAFDTQLQRNVAIKLLHANLRDDPNFVTRFQREAQLIASLHHPNIVQVHDFQITQPTDSPDGTASRIAYMVMDYVEGQTLADYIHKTSSKGHIPAPAEIVRLFTSISLAVDYAHQKGMIHRDIKPANILLDGRNATVNTMGEPILTDFGVAKLMSNSANTMSGAQLGTPLYISPEQARGYAGNERSDLYSLGVILYELVTGVTPFRGDTPMDVITQQINSTPMSPVLINPNIPPALTLVIMRSLAKDPAARFPNASSMAVALAEALSIPVPEAIGQFAASQEASGSPPVQTLQRPLSSPAMVDNAPATPVIASMTPSQTTGGADGQAMPTPSVRYVQQMATGSPTPLVVSRATPTTPGTPTPSMAPIPPQTRQKQRRGWYLFLLPLLLLLLIAASVGAYFTFFRGTTTPVVATSIVGQAYFTSSGQFTPGSASGIADQLKIHLENIPAPHTGKSYYLWLLGDKSPNTDADLVGTAPIKVPLLLSNSLPVHNGAVDYLYTGSATQHNNLLSVGSRLLITEEVANSTPTTPSTDNTTWRYYAELPQELIPQDPIKFNALLHIRHLFYNESSIKILGLPGGLDVWIFRNTEKLLEWSISARDDWHGTATTQDEINLMQAQFVRILDYLDGAPNVHLDVAPNTPLLTDPVIARVALLTVDAQHQGGNNSDKNPPGYVDHIQFHVGQINKAIDLTPAMRKTSASIIEAINNAKTWLLNAHKDAVQLYNLTPDQLKQPAAKALLDDLAVQITYAYIGQPDPVTNQVHPGVLQMHYDVQQLAAFQVTSKVPANI